MTALRSDFRNTFVSARSYRSTEDEIGQDLERAENYLSLVGLVVVVLGGIGVSSVTRVFVEQKLKSIAVLKCVGASSRQVLSVYLLQVMVLGLAGSLMGWRLAASRWLHAPAELGTAGATASAVARPVARRRCSRRVGIGLLVSLLFSLVPLLRVRHIRPSLLLRQQDGGPGRRDWLRADRRRAGRRRAGGARGAGRPARGASGAPCAAGSRSVALVLHVAGWALVRATAPLAAGASFALRHAVLRLNRPGNQTRVVLLAVGLGAFFIIGVRGVQSNLLRDFCARRRRPRRPTCS